VPKLFPLLKPKLQYGKITKDTKTEKSHAKTQRRKGETEERQNSRKKAQEAQKTGKNNNRGWTRFTQIWFWAPTTVILRETYFAANNVFRLVLIVSKKDAM
jgi:hypothetical protein